MFESGLKPDIIDFDNFKIAHKHVFKNIYFLSLVVVYLGVDLFSCLGLCYSFPKCCFL